MASLPRLTVGMAGPVSLDLLEYPRGVPQQLPPGYPAPIVAHYTNALLRRGHTVSVFTTSRELSQPVVFDQGNLVVCVAPRYRPRSAVSFYARERRWLRSLMQEHPCDLVHAMWSYEFALAALQSHTPSVVHYRDHAWTIFRHSPDAYRLLRLLLDTYVTARASNRIANSAYMSQQISFPGRDVPVIPNFLPSSFAVTPRDTSPRTKGTIVTVSNGFYARKNVTVALRAFADLRAQGLASEYRLVGAGCGPGQEAQAYAAQHGLADGVTFLGALPFERALAEIGAAALLLHPSLEESFGMTILEAMALGTPVVAGREAGNVPELLGGGSCGYLCDVRDHADIERAVATCLAEADDRAEKVLRARHRFEALYSEEAVMNDLELYYSRMLGLVDGREVHS